MHHVMVIMSFGTHPTDVHIIIIIIIIISQPASQPSHVIERSNYC
jgi:hypothetical protein